MLCEDRPFRTSKMVGYKYQTYRCSSTAVLLTLHIIVSVTVIFLSLLATKTEGCVRSSMYYRSRIRSRSHVFLIGEHQPRQTEHTLEGSGPLDRRDFHDHVPNKELVRVDSPFISFDSEEARWMTEGCRDRLIKLAIQIQNTWAKQDVKLRVLRGWIKPPPNYKPMGSIRQSSEYSDHGSGVEKTGESLMYEIDRRRVPNLNTKAPIVHDRLKSSMGQLEKFGRPKVKNRFVDPIMEMSPEMIVREADDITIKRNRFFTQSVNEIPSSAYNDRSSYRQNPTWTPWRPHRGLNVHYQQGFNNRQPSMILSLPNPIGGDKFRYPRYVADENTDVSGSHNDPATSRKVGRSVDPLYWYRPTSNSNNYQPVNTMRQVAVDQWLSMRMEEFHYAGRAVDFQLTTKHGAIVPKPNFNLGVLAQIAYYVAQFDWCYNNPAGHVHCSVKPDSSMTSQWFGCFPTVAKVQTENGGSILMRDLKVGDRVLTQDLSSGKKISTTVVSFLHRDEHAWKTMMRIQFFPKSERWNMSLINTSLHLTMNHMIYVVRRTNSGASFALTYASLVRPGDTILFSHSGEQAPNTAVVTNVTCVTEWSRELSGIYAPLTEEGTLIVDNVVVSCFAEFAHQNLAQVVLWPLRFVYELRSWLNLTSVGFETNGLNTYARYLYQIASAILPTKYFFYEER